MGFYSYHDADLHLLIGVGLLLLQMSWPRRWWPSSCRSSSLHRRGSWIAGKAQSRCRRMDWWLLSAPLGTCTWNMIPVVPRLMPSSRTSLPGLTPLVLGLNGLSTSTEHWSSARFNSAYRRQTWRSKRPVWFLQRQLAQPATPPLPFLPRKA
jgi:hypothetical protein